MIQLSAARSGPRRTAGVLGISVVGLAAGVAVLALALHAPVVRAAVLRRALAVVQERYGLRLEAARLDYNLAALRLGLADVRLSAPAAADPPFFEADYLAVAFPTRVLAGALAFQDVTVTNGRVRLLWRADGTSNLPRPPETPAGDPAPLAIARLALPRVMVEVRDDRRDLSLRVPAVAITLTRDAGRIALLERVELRHADRVARISQLEGQATFDGRSLRLQDARLRSDEAALRLDGSLLLIAREAAVDLQLEGTADAARLARWGMADGQVPAGDVAFKGRVTGPMGSPEAQLRLSTSRLSWQGLTAVDVTAQAQVTSAAADVQRLEFGLEGGRVLAAAVLPFDDGVPAHVAMSWTAVDAASLVRAVAPASRLVPAGAASGALTADGPLGDRTRWVADARLQLQPARGGRARLAIAGNARLQLTQGAWRLDGQHLIGGTAPVTVALRGRLTTATAPRAPIDGTIQIGRTDVPALVERLRTAGLIRTEGRSDGTGEGEGPPLRSGTLEADIDVGGRLDDPRLDARVRLRDVIASEARADAVDATFAGRPLQSRFTFTLAAPGVAIAGQPIGDLHAAGRVDGTRITVDDLLVAQPSGSGRLIGTGTYDLSTTQYDASIDAAEWQLAPAAGQPLAGRLAIRFSGSGTTAAPKGAGEIILRDAHVASDATRVPTASPSDTSLALGDLIASVRLDGRSADIEARLPEFRTTATARVRLEAPYLATVDAVAEALDLARLLRDIETRVPIEGAGTLRAHAEGPLESWRLGTASVDVSGFTATAGGLSIRTDGAARIRYAGERVHVDRLEAAVGDARLSASGELPAFDPAPDAPGLLLTMTGSVDAVVRAAAASGVVGLPVAGGEGAVALLSRIGGSLRAPVVSADLEVGPGSIALDRFPPITALHVRARAEDGWIELREATAAYQGARLSATGRAPLSALTDRVAATSGGDLVLKAQATDVSPAVLASLVDAATLDQLSGSADVTLELSGPAVDPARLAGELRLDRFEMRVADLPITQRVPTRIAARDGFARVEAWEWVGRGSALEVRGQVNLSDRQAAILANGEFDLRLLTPFVRNAGVSTAGRLAPRLSITGALDSPRVDGEIALTDGELRMADPRILVSGVRAHAVLSRSTAQIASLTGLVNGGAMTGGGTIEYTPGGPLGAQLTANVRGMALEFPEGLRSEVDAMVGLNAAGASGRVSGTVTVVRGAYRQPLAVVTGLLTTMRTRRLAAVAERSPLLEGLALDVRLLTDEDIIVDNNYGRVQLGADLRLIGTAAAPVLAGRAELREGGQLFVGRNVYTVSFGSIDFANPVVIEPDLNVEATTRAGGEDIEVTITGTPDTIGVDLRSTSDPGLGQAEIASLLLTGRRFEDLDPGDAAFVGTQVLGNFSAEVLGFAGRAVGLDTLRLGGVDTAAQRRDPSAVATEIDPTTRLTFGKSIGANVDVTFSQSLSDGDAQTWIVDYLAARRLELRVVSDDENLRSYGFRHDLAFGAPPRAAAPADQTRRQPPARVAALRLAGELAVPENRLRAELRLTPGNRFDYGAWQGDRDRLEQFYRREGYLTARVAAARSDGADGVELLYEIAPGPRTAIAATGVELTPSLRARLETAWSQSVFDDFLVEETEGIVRDALARAGYLQPRVSARVVAEGDGRTLAIEVERGARTSRTIVRIDGADPELAHEIEAWLVARGMGDRATADSGALERDVTGFLRRRGHLGARVAAGAPVLTEDVAVQPLAVEAGAMFTIARVSFEGAGGLARDALEPAAALEAGQPYDPEAAEAARQRLFALYRREGFPAAVVTVQQEGREDAPAVDLRFVVAEGPRQVLADVAVSGNRAIDADVIVGALGLELETPLRAEESLRARTRLFGTGLFRRVDVSADAIAPGGKGSRTIPMRMTVTVEEWPALRLRYGFQVAEERPEGELEGRNLVPGVSADLTRRTLFGRAITTGGAIQLQRREQRARVFLNAPTLFGWPIETSVVAEREREEFSAATLESDRNSIAWEQRTRVARHLSLSYAYRFDRDHTFDTKPPDPNIPAFDVTVNIARLTGSAAWDTRDDPADTTRGLLLSSSMEFAPATAGSDIRFVRQLAQAYHFRPWRNVVFASAGRFGVVRPLGGQELIPSVRFFAGGARTVRGVSEDGLGDRNFFGDPIGGQALIVVNQEARFPIHRWLRGVAFVDAGNVFTRLGEASLTDLIGSVGFGVRLATPFALLRADAARAVWGQPRENAWRWSFGIGHAF